MIESVKVYFDDNVPEDMAGITRLSSVISKSTVTNDEGNCDDIETDHQDLIDNEEFHSIDDAIAFVADKLQIHTDLIECP